MKQNGDTTYQTGHDSHWHGLSQGIRQVNTKNDHDSSIYVPMLYKNELLQQNTVTVRNEHRTVTESWYDLPAVMKNSPTQGTSQENTKNDHDSSIVVFNARSEWDSTEKERRWKLEKNNDIWRNSETTTYHNIDRI